MTEFYPLKFSCKLCGIESPLKGFEQITDAEYVQPWLDTVVAEAIENQHHLLSPDCPATEALVWRVL